MFILSAGTEGFEPPRTVLETIMLPLHHAPVKFAERIIKEIVSFGKNVIP